ncbi:FMN-binding protein [Peloplasma aerotolerans]|uniref:FMN-binding protein n=1 Tax=Peloplasma aerotolerans TaxID=3044389 RepID=A0AAW6UB00_9MOLU|nr:FMN-binding protein [Mariniplasma sp. M4Ah]MDI6453363.1 FMN-binding protein [Mariniplasma sp. M4Ah]MDR4969261.1 FMN-binding protein [Acholeplasmataceae bacterium]
MIQHLKLILFVVVLGSVTSLLLLGMDHLTRERIIANEEAEIKATLLKAYDIEFTYANIHDVFDDHVQIIEIDGLIFYLEENSGAISFHFDGGGVWGPITGIITLESDFETIKAVAVLQQEETPGLGGVVAESQYLAKFVGVKMVPELIITKTVDPDADNEVDAIVGATRTSNAFRNILNNAYALHLDAWNSRND